jgi:exodeoxyribonuclease VIII
MIMNTQIKLDTENTWHHKIKPAYDKDGKANYLDKNSELIEGIYTGLENNIYHSLNAYSSSLLKTLAKDTPAHVYRAYYSDIERKRTLSQTRTLDTGTLGHELILEPDGFLQRYFKLPCALDYPNSLVTSEQLKNKCKSLGLKISGSKKELIDRLIEHDKAIEIFDVVLEEAIKKGIGNNAYQKAMDLVNKKTVTSLPRAIETDEIKSISKKIAIDSIVWDDAFRVQATFLKHKHASKFINDGWAELTVISKCPITNLWLKCKFDYINKLAIASDVKTTRSANPTKFSYQCRDLRYDLQEAFYKYVGNLAGIPINIFGFIAVEYLEADICEVFELSKTVQQRAEADMKESLELLKICIETDEWRGYSSNDNVMVLNW